MDQVLPACRPGDPFLAPDWRWMRARQIETKPGQLTDDPWVNLTCDYLRRGAAATRYRLVEDALRLRDERSRLLRFEVEARLLARQSFQAIEQSTGVPAATVEAYSQLFYDVCGRLQARDWIQLHAIQVIAGASYAAVQPGGLWRNVGYHCGLDLLELVLAVDKGERIPDRFLHGGGEAREDEEKTLRILTLFFIKTELADTTEKFAEVVKLRRAYAYWSGDDAPMIKILTDFLVRSTAPTPRNQSRKAPTETSATHRHHDGPANKDQLLVALTALN